jgi:hypothetical protein
MNWITNIFKPISDVVNKWQDGRQKKSERIDRIKEAECLGRIAVINKYVDGDNNADLEAMRQMQYSWKDEYLTIVFTLPFLYSFFDVIIKGGTTETAWKAVALAPDWYQWCLTGIVMATFGLRAWAARTRIK